MSPLIAATALSLVMAAVALVLAARAESSSEPQLWAIVIGTSVLAGGLILLSTARAVRRGMTDDDSAQLPASEGLRQSPLVLGVVAAAIFAEIVGTGGLRPSRVW